MACPYMRHCQDYSRQTKNYQNDYCNDSIRCRGCGYYPGATQEMKNKTQNYQNREANDKAANNYLIKAALVIAVIVWFFYKFG